MIVIFRGITQSYKDFAYHFELTATTLQSVADFAVALPITAHSLVGLISSTIVHNVMESTLLLNLDLNTLNQHTRQCSRQNSRLERFFLLPPHFCKQQIAYKMGAELKWSDYKATQCWNRSRIREQRYSVHGICKISQ